MSQKPILLFILPRTLPLRTSSSRNFIMVRLSHSYNDREYYQKTFDKLDIEYRVLATRGMIVDLAMISGLWASGKELLPEANICSIRYGQNNSLRLFVVNHLQLKCLQACISWFGVGSSIWQSRRHGQRGSKG